MGLTHSQSPFNPQERYVAHLLSICDRFAPGTSDLVVDTFTLTPPKIESHFGITRGHIHHIDNSFGFDERFPYRTPVQVGRPLPVATRLIPDIGCNLTSKTFILSVDGRFLQL